MHDFRFPAEWEAQQSLWTAFPFDAHEWGDQLSSAQLEIATFVATLAQNKQYVDLICRSADMQKLAHNMIHNIIGNSSYIRFHNLPYGDIWLRDTGPITISNGKERRAAIFAFNGWGEKFLMDGDQKIGNIIAESQKLPIEKSHLIFEGGAIDVDGIGNAVTTKQCVLNPNRNPKHSEEGIESILEQQLGISRLLWLGDGLAGDHTDGHVDNLARFIRPNHLLIPQSNTPDDPNTKVYEDAAIKARDFGFKVSRMVSAGRYVINDYIVPASYMNFVIVNDIIIVPQFNILIDLLALETISHFFPNKQCIGLSSVALLSGGGSFHCASQQLAAI